MKWKVNIPNHIMGSLICLIFSELEVLHIKRYIKDNMGVQVVIIKSSSDGSNRQTLSNYAKHSRSV